MYRCIEGVEQLTHDPLLTVGGAVRGISCAVVDYDALRGLDDPSHRLF